MQFAFQETQPARRPLFHQSTAFADRAAARIIKNPKPLAAYLTLDPSRLDFLTTRSSSLPKRTGFARRRHQHGLRRSLVRRWQPHWARPSMGARICVQHEPQERNRSLASVEALDHMLYRGDPAHIDPEARTALRTQNKLPSRPFVQNRSIVEVSQLQSASAALRRNSLGATPNTRLKALLNAASES